MNIETLDNGLTVITENNPHIFSFNTQVWVRAGSRYENKENNGISHFLEHMYFMGSKNFPDKHLIEKSIERSGGHCNAFTGKEFVFYMVNSPSTQIELSSDILSSMLKEPLFRDEDIETEKGAVINEIKERYDDLVKYTWKLYDELMFGDQPLGWEITGDERKVNSFVREDIIKYMDSLYSPTNMVLVYVGNLPKNICEIANKYYGNLPPRSSFKFEPYKKTRQDKHRVGTAYRKSEKVQMILGVEGYDRFSPKIQAADLLSNILGKGGSSKLHYELRDKRGLAYGIRTKHQSYIDTGSFVTYTSVNPDDFFQALRIILEEFQKIGNEKVSDNVLSDAKEMVKGKKAMAMENSHYLATSYGKSFILRGRIKTYQEFCDSIDAVTADDILDVAQELLRPEKFNLQIVGPIKKKQREESYKTLAAA